MIIIVPDGMGDRGRGPGGLPQALSLPTIGARGENTLNKPLGLPHLFDSHLPRDNPDPGGSRCPVGGTTTIDSPRRWAGATRPPGTQN